MSAVYLFLGHPDNSLEGNCNVKTRVGIDHRPDWPRLGFVYHNYRLAQVHEVGATIFSSRGAQQISNFAYDIV